MLASAVEMSYSVAHDEVWRGFVEAARSGGLAVEHTATVPTLEAYDPSVIVAPSIPRQMLSSLNSTALALLGLPALAQLSQATAEASGWGDVTLARVTHAAVRENVCDLAARFMSSP